MVFIDVEKAFDIVHREVIYKILEDIVRTCDRISTGDIQNLLKRTKLHSDGP